MIPASVGLNAERWQIKALSVCSACPWVNEQTECGHICANFTQNAAGRDSQQPGTEMCGYWGLLSPCTHLLQFAEARTSCLRNCLSLLWDDRSPTVEGCQTSSRSLYCWSTSMLPYGNRWRNSDWTQCCSTPATLWSISTNYVFPVSCRCWNWRV